MLNRKAAGKTVGIVLPAVLLLSTPLGCGPASENDIPPMRIVLWDSFGGIYTAEWINRSASVKPVRKYWGEFFVRGASTQGDLLALAGFRRAEEYAVLLGDPDSGKMQEIFSEENVGPFSPSIALGPDLKKVAFISLKSPQPVDEPSSRNEGDSSSTRRTRKVEKFDLALYDLATRQSRLLVRSGPTISSSLSWTPNGEEVTFDSWSGWITSVTVKDGAVTRVVKGTSPAWSPDGRWLAYFPGSIAWSDEVFLYDRTSGAKKRLYWRWFWQGSIGPGLHWSPDGRYVSLRVVPWVDDSECIVVEVQTRKSFSVGSYWCGPWLPEKKREEQLSSVLSKRVG